MKFGYFFEDLLQEAKGRPMSPEKFEAITILLIILFNYQEYHTLVS
jgi:hypothetical protein